MSRVLLGTDVETGDAVWIGDVERRSGLYLLGRPGMGKSALMVNMMVSDIANGHGLFFLTAWGCDTGIIPARQIFIFDTSRKVGVPA